jgi:hypothetical protein
VWLQEDDEDYDFSDGFWEEFFLLRPDGPGLKHLLGSMNPDDLLHTQAHSQQLFLRAIVRVKQATAPSDEVALEVRSPPIPSLFAGLQARP